MTMRLLDSYSDGMSGWVEVSDVGNGHKVKVHWCVMWDDIDSQHAALDEAHTRLAAMNENGRTVVEP